MHRVLLYIIICLIFIDLTKAQVRVIKPVKTHALYTNLGVSSSLMRSVLFLSRNVKQNNDALGFHAAVVYGGDKLFRGSMEYTSYKKINIEPTWYNIKANTIEFNLHVLARFKKTKAYFYPLFGLSYNSFSGYFTGLNDFLNLTEKYRKNETATTKWIGLNVGSGYEHFFRQLSIFGEYKMRVGTSSKNQLNIMDVCYNFGLRYNLIIPSVYKLFSGTKNRYSLKPTKNQN